MEKHHRLAVTVSCHYSELKEKDCSKLFTFVNASECSVDQFQRLFLHSSECNEANDLDKLGRNL